MNRDRRHLIKMRSFFGRSEFFETARVGKQFAKDAPRLSGGGVESGRRARLEEVESGNEVVRTAAVLQAGDELQQDAVDAVAETRLVPVGVERVFLALVEHQRADVVVVDRTAWKVEVPVAQGLQHAEAAATAAAGQ